ncbi:MAG: hypothetical protein MI747_14025 [Desulfobacterales bacterium]|nr:hypothetical protein [Desulfobacterales bacterium]
MKITDPDVIKHGEQDLIEAVTSDLDMEAVKQILKDRLKAAPLASKGGEIVVHENQIAFRLDFEVQLSGSLLFDREGNYLAAAEPDAPVEFDMPVDEADMDAPMEAAPIMDEPAMEDPIMDLTEEDIPEEPQEDVPVEMDLDEEDLIPESQLPELDLAQEEPMEAESVEELDLDEEELAIDLPDYEEDDLLDEDDEEVDITLTEEEVEIPELPDQEEMGPEDLPQDELLQEKMLDDDISDIIKESREFWEQKKNS